MTSPRTRPSRRNYANGARLERDAKDQLETDGYWCVRSAGSKGVVDVLAMKPGQMLMVQAKKDGVCPPAERAALLELASRFEALPLVAFRDRGVKYRRLTGPGPKEWVPWEADGEQPKPGTREARS